MKLLRKAAIFYRKGLNGVNNETGFEIILHKSSGVVLLLATKQFN